MATIQVNKLIADAGIALQDVGNIRWTAADLLGYLNDGQREIVLIKPEACVKNAAISLNAGSTKQSLPADAIILIDISRNMGANGSTPGRVIRLTTKELIDAQLPDWHSEANTLGFIQQYTYDPRDPKTFYVYPKAPATAWYVDAIYSSVPEDAVAGGAIKVDDIYANALLDYMLYRAYAKDAEYAANASLAAAHYQAFASALGVKANAEQSRNPNTAISNMSYNPAIPSASTGASTGK